MDLRLCFRFQNHYIYWTTKKLSLPTLEELQDWGKVDYAKKALLSLCLICYISTKKPERYLLTMSVVRFVDIVIENIFLWYLILKNLSGKYFKIYVQALSKLQQ